MIEREVVELRARVAQLEHTVQFMVRQLGLQVPPQQQPHGVSARVMGLVKQANKIGAIAAYREETGADLATAKRVIDDLG